MKGITQLKEKVRSLKGDVQRLKGKVKEDKFSIKILESKRYRIFKDWYIVLVKL